VSLNAENPHANIWQDEFPYRNTALDGLERTASVRSFRAGGYRLYHKAGGDWEPCSDGYFSDLYRRQAGFRA
jgi:hypothetical protein